MQFIGSDADVAATGAVGTAAPADQSSLVE
jgi:hypothetical protein